MFGRSARGAPARANHRENDADEHEARAGGEREAHPLVGSVAMHEGGVDAAEQSESGEPERRESCERVRQTRRPVGRAEDAAQTPDKHRVAGEHHEEVERECNRAADRVRGDEVWLPALIFAVCNAGDTGNARGQREKMK